MAAATTGRDRKKRGSTTSGAKSTAKGTSAAKRNGGKKATSTAKRTNAKANSANGSRTADAAKAKAQVLALIKKTPSITVHAVAKAMGWEHAPRAWYYVNQLEQDGTIKKATCSECGHDKRVVV